MEELCDYLQCEKGNRDYGGQNRTVLKACSNTNYSAGIMQFSIDNQKWGSRNPVKRWAKHIASVKRLVLN